MLQCFHGHHSSPPRSLRVSSRELSRRNDLSSLGVASVWNSYAWQNSTAQRRQTKPNRFEFVSQMQEQCSLGGKGDNPLPSQRSNNKSNSWIDWTVAWLVDWNGGHKVFPALALENEHSMPTPPSTKWDWRAFLLHQVRKWKKDESHTIAQTPRVPGTRRWKRFGIQFAGHNLWRSILIHQIFRSWGVVPHHSTKPKQTKYSSGARVARHVHRLPQQVSRFWSA